MADEFEFDTIWHITYITAGMRKTSVSQMAKILLRKALDTGKQQPSQGVR